MATKKFALSQLAIKLCTVALAMAIAGAATLASATPPLAPGNGSFLALGDSVPFGYIAGDGPAYVNPKNFVGYPDYVGGEERQTRSTALALEKPAAVSSFQPVPTMDAVPSAPTSHSTLATPPPS